MSPDLRILLDSGPYSLSTSAVTGIGLRVAEFADTLSADFRVRVFTPHTADLVPVGGAEVFDHRSSWRWMLAETDAVVFFDCPDGARLEEAANSGKLIVSENVAPIEHLEYPSLLATADPAAVYRELVAGYARQLAVSQHFLCRSDVERATLVANLCLAGRLAPADIARSRTVDHLVTLVPIGYSARSLAAARATPPRYLADFLWTGGVWSFYDPLLFVHALALCRDRGLPVTGAFLHAAAVPDNAALLDALRAEVSRRGLRERVTFLADPVRHDERDAYLKAARGLVCVAKPGVENQTCVRLRVRDNRLHGIPVVVDGYGATATEVARDGHGVVLRELSVEHLADTLVRLSTCTAATTDAQPESQEEFCYENTLRGFISWLKTALP